MKISPTVIQDCFLIEPKVHSDPRGTFIKILEDQAFSRFGLETKFGECFYSKSKKNVLRGLHFQIPPEHGAKLVYCVSGEVEDVAVDLRVGSPTYGRHERIKLDSDSCNALYLPSGLAHGFLALSDDAVMLYHITTAYSPAHDKGILWNSAGIPWSTERPILSDRDRDFPPLAEFKSPFIWKKQEC